MENHQKSVDVTAGLYEANRLTDRQHAVGAACNLLFMPSPSAGTATLAMQLSQPHISGKTQTKIMLFDDMLTVHGLRVLN